MKRRQRGYVLLMALLVLCLAITILTGLTRHSLNAALKANEASTSLQERWGTYSLKKALRALRESTYGGNANLKLGGLEYRIAYQNENAKLNLNQVVKWHGQQTVYKACQDLCGEFSLDLAPNDFSENRRIRNTFESWGQVFDLSAISSSPEYREWLAERTRRITLWGNGQLSWQHADEQTLGFLLSQLLSPVDARTLMEARKKKATFDQALTKINSKGAELERFLAEDVECLRADIDVVDGAATVSRYTFIESDFGSDIWISW